MLTNKKSQLLHSGESHECIAMKSTSEGGDPLLTLDSRASITIFLKEVPVANKSGYVIQKCYGNKKN